MSSYKRTATYRIKRRLVVCCLFIGMLVNGVSPSYAQAAPPPGSYLQSCQDVRVNRGTLSATCQKMDGTFAGAAIVEYRTCTDDIANLDGVLVCSKSTLPTGTYQRSCYATLYDPESNYLHVRCRTIGGEWISSEMNDVSLCSGDVTNLDGVLVCSDWNLPGVPDGSYQASCYDIFVWEAPQSRQRQLVATCRTVQGEWQPTVLTNRRGEPIDFRECTDDIGNRDGSLKCS